MADQSKMLTLSGTTTRNPYFGTSRVNSTVLVESCEDEPSLVGQKLEVVCFSSSRAAYDKAQSGMLSNGKAVTLNGKYQFNRYQQKWELAVHYLYEAADSAVEKMNANAERVAQVRHAALPDLRHAARAESSEVAIVPRLTPIDPNRFISVSGRLLREPVIKERVAYFTIGIEPTLQVACAPTHLRNAQSFEVVVFNPHGSGIVGLNRIGQSLDSLHAGDCIFVDGSWSDQDAMPTVRCEPSGIHVIRDLTPEQEAALVADLVSEGF